MKKIIFGLSIVLVMTGFVLKNSILFGLCGVDERFSCIQQLSLIGQPLFILSFSVFISLIPCLFFSEQIFKSWFKFAVIFIPLAVLAIIFLPTDEGGFGLPSIFTAETVTWASAVIYLIGSFLIILIKSLKLRRVQ